MGEEIDEIFTPSRRSSSASRAFSRAFPARGAAINASRSSVEGALGKSRVIRFLPRNTPSPPRELSRRTREIGCQHTIAAQDFDHEHGSCATTAAASHRSRPCQFHRLQTHGLQRHPHGLGKDSNRLKRNAAASTTTSSPHDFFTRLRCSSNPAAACLESCKWPNAATSVVMLRRVGCIRPRGCSCGFGREARPAPKAHGKRGAVGFLLIA
jgi:hypothetical protein